MTYCIEIFPFLLMKYTLQWSPQANLQASTAEAEKLYPLDMRAGTLLPIGAAEETLHQS